LAQLTTSPVIGILTDNNNNKSFDRQTCLSLAVGGKMAEEPIANATVVAVLATGEDRTALASILAHSGWTLWFARDLPEARTLLRKTLPTVVITDRWLADGHSWKDLLELIEEPTNPPALIVSDRLADEALWAEVLNLGAYDLLTKPFDAKEVLHVVNAAQRRYENTKQFGMGAGGNRTDLY
jgi:DNA-binding response OmpR family regulator